MEYKNDYMDYIIYVFPSEDLGEVCLLCGDVYPCTQDYRYLGMNSLTIYKEWLNGSMLEVMRIQHVLLSFKIQCDCCHV